MLPMTCKQVSPLEKILSLAEPCMGPACCKVCCLEIMKKSHGKALGVWELISVRVPGGDNVAGAGLQMLQSSVFPATEHLCYGFQLHLFQAPVSAHHKHALFLSRLLQRHLCLQHADALSMPMYFIVKATRPGQGIPSLGWEAGR